MADNFTLPIGSNTYVPSFEASSKLVVDFVRNPSKFRLNDYIAIKKVSRDVGYYAKIKAEEAVRVLNTTDYDWADGADAPKHQGVNSEFFEFLQYKTLRTAYPFVIGLKAVQQAAWDIVAEFAAIEASKAMTLRTMTAENILNNTANWGNNTATATSLGGGLWSNASSSNFYIKKSLLSAVQSIVRATNGAITISDLNLVVSPNLAATMATTDEIANYVKSSPFSMEVLTGKAFIDRYGLPSYLYGLKVIVEDAVKVTSGKGLTRSDSFVQASTDAFILARTDSLVSVHTGSPSFSTIQMFAYEEFTDETREDPDNRKVNGRVVQDIDFELVAPASGYYITSCQ